MHFILSVKMRPYCTECERRMLFDPIRALKVAIRRTFWIEEKKSKRVGMSSVTVKFMLAPVWKFDHDSKGKLATFRNTQREER